MYTGVTQGSRTCGETTGQQPCRLLISSSFIINTSKGLWTLEASQSAAARCGAREARQHLRVCLWSLVALLFGSQDHYG